MKIGKEKRIKCAKCWMEIEKIWCRKYCLQCRRIKDYELRMEYKKKRRAVLKLKKQKNEVSSDETN